MLTENSMYADVNGRQALLKNKELCAELFTINFLGFVGLFALSDSRGYMKTYETTEKKLNIDDIGDENHDVSLILKLCVEAKIIDDNKLTPIIKFLTLIKSKTLKAKDIDEDKLRANIRALQVATKPMNAIIRGNLNDWLNGDKCIQELAFNLYNMAKKSEWRDYTLEFRTLVIKGRYSDFFSAMAKGTWVKPSSGDSKSSPVVPEQSLNSNLVKQFENILSAPNGLVNISKILVQDKPNLDDVMKSLQQVEIKSSMDFINNFDIDNAIKILKPTQYMAIYQMLFQLVFIKLHDIYLANNKIYLLKLDGKMLNLNNLNGIINFVENKVEKWDTPSNVQEYLNFMNYAVWANPLMDSATKRKFSDIKVFTHKTPTQIFKYFAYSLNKEVMLDSKNLSDSDKNFVDKLGLASPLCKWSILSDSEKMSKEKWAELTTKEKVLFFIKNLETSAISDIDALLAHSYIREGQTQYFDECGTDAILGAEFSKLDDKKAYDIFTKPHKSSRKENACAIQIMAFMGYVIYQFERHNRVVDVSPVVNYILDYYYTIFNQIEDSKYYFKITSALFKTCDMSNVNGVDVFMKLFFASISEHKIYDKSPKFLENFTQYMGDEYEMLKFVLEALINVENGPNKITFASTNPVILDISNLSHTKIVWIKRFGDLVKIYIYEPAKNSEQDVVRMFESITSVKNYVSKITNKDEQEFSKKLTIKYLNDKIQPLLDKQGLTKEVLVDFMIKNELPSIKVYKSRSEFLPNCSEKIDTYFLYCALNCQYKKLDEVLSFKDEVPACSERICGEVEDWPHSDNFNKNFTATALNLDTEIAITPKMLQICRSEVMKVISKPKINVRDPIIKGMSYGGGDYWLGTLFNNANVDSDYNKGVMFFLCCNYKFKPAEWLELKPLLDKIRQKELDNIDELIGVSKLQDIEGINPEWLEGVVRTSESLKKPDLRSLDDVLFIHNKKLIFKRSKVKNSLVEITFLLSFKNEFLKELGEKAPEYRQAFNNSLFEVLKTFEYADLISTVSLVSNLTLLDDNKEALEFYKQLCQKFLTEIETSDFNEKTKFCFLITVSQKLINHLDDSYKKYLIEFASKSDSALAKNAIIRAFLDDRGNLLPSMSSVIDTLEEEHKGRTLKAVLDFKSLVKAVDEINSQGKGIKLDFEDVDYKEYFKCNDVDMGSITTTNIEKLEDLRDDKKILSVYVPKIPMEEFSEEESKEKELFLHENNGYNHEPSFGLEVLRSYKYDSKAMKDKFDAWCATHPNAQFKTLLHGTGSIAGAFILRYGFKIIGESGVTGLLSGRSMGNGIYFADNTAKSAFYMSNSGYLRKVGIKGYIFKCKVAMDVNGKDYLEAWKTEAFRGFVSNEWCVFNTEQCLIEEVYECLTVDKEEFIKSFK